MYKIKPFSVSRSSTKQQLPTISARTPRNGGIVHSKSYLGQISKQFSGNAEYDQMDNSKLTKEQRKLKDILRKMNEDTVKIISDYTPRAKKQQHHRTATTILAVNEQQLVNNQKIMLQCQMEISKLQQRAQGLSVGGKELYDEQIGKIYQEVLVLQEENKSLRNQNDRRGKSIVTENRIIQQGQIRKLETDVYLAEHRASHLRADDFRVTEQIKQYEKKQKQMATKWNQAQKFLKDQQKKQKQRTNLKINEQELFHKKAVLQNTRKKNEFYNQNCQYKYLSLLRQLDASTTTAKQLQNKIDKNFVSMQASKMIISKLQNQLRTIKQKKKEKEEQINQFLNKTRNQNGSRLIQIDNKQMLSQIQINQQNNGDISAMDIQQAIVGLADKKSDSKKGSRIKENKYEEIQSVIKTQNNALEQRNDVLL